MMKGHWFMHPLGRPGGDLLSRALRRSTIGPGGLNDRVRNGIGWGTPGKTTRSTKRMREDIIARRVTYAWRTWVLIRTIKPIERLVPVSFMRHRTSTPGLST